MSSSGRTGLKAGKGAKPDKSHKTDGGKGGGGGDSKVHNNKENHPATKNEELSMKDKVKQLMELTCRSEDEVCLALHESDLDVNLAINLLYEEPSTGEWETKDKKKKKRQTSTDKTVADKKDDWDDEVVPAPIVGEGKDWKERGGGNRNRERNASRGGGRGWREGGRGRGRGGGRTGGRYPPRGGSRGGGGSRQQQPIDTWDSSNTWDNSAAAPAPPPVDDWDDLHTDEWSTEEYTGSLVETKVFTPSVQNPGGGNDSFDAAAPPSLDASYQQQAPPPPQSSPVPPMVGALTAAQTQYFSQLSQQNSASSAAYPTQPATFDTKPNVQQNYSNSTPYAQTASTQGYGVPQAAYAAYQEPQPQPQQRPRTQRARVPPPSKIPASAVEMPGDLNSSGGAYLDVQFGAMDLIDSSFESSVAAISLDNSITAPTETDTYATKNNGSQQSSISTALSQGLSNSDIPPTVASDNLTYRNSAQTSAAQPLTVDKQSSDSYGSQSASYNSYGSKGNNYPYQVTTASSYVNSPSVTSYGTNQASSYGSQNASYSNSSYSSTTAQQQVYQNATYPQATQNNLSAVYGTNTGLSNNSNYSSAQYNSYNKLKDNNSYDASATSTTTSTAAASKTTAKNATSVMSNIPQGVAPVMSTPYIMGQMPYFQQHPAAVYSFEDVQLLQQRMPHMTTPYYDVGYQTPTTLATVRGDPTATALGGYGAAAAADARFQAAGRAGDGAASPVPAASQQQQQQQAPILAATPAPGAATPYFFAAAPYNTLGAPPNYAQFYTQLPTVTNASNQYGPKPATYGSTAGYGAYDAQDYSKASYATVGAAAAVAAAAAQKGQANSTSAASGAADLSAMYGKTHAALGKVNSYEKQGFHSGTPPPFTGTLSQSAGGAAYAQQVYIPTLPQHHSTMAMHQPLHQMDVRHQGRRADSSSGGGGGGQRSQQQQGGSSAGQAKAGAKQQQGGYGASYWNQN